MRHLSLLALLLLPGLARAEDPLERKYIQLCSGCHTLSPTPSAAAEFNKAGARRQARSLTDKRVELGTLIHKRSPEQLVAWLKDPSQSNKESRCDPKGLSPAELEPMITYLSIASVKPPPPTREVLLKQQLEEDIVQQRQAKKAPTRVSPSTPPTLPTQRKK